MAGKYSTSTAGGGGQFWKVIFVAVQPCCFTHKLCRKELFPEFMLMVKEKANKVEMGCDRRPNYVPGESIEGILDKKVG